jgi:hypothetical protein
MKQPTTPTRRLEYETPRPRPAPDRHFLNMILTLGGILAVGCLTSFLLLLANAIQY